MKGLVDSLLDNELEENMDILQDKKCHKHVTNAPKGIGLV